MGRSSGRDGQKKETKKRRKHSSRSQSSSSRERNVRKRGKKRDRSQSSRYYRNSGGDEDRGHASGARDTRPLNDVDRRVSESDSGDRGEGSVSTGERERSQGRREGGSRRSESTAALHFDVKPFKTYFDRMFFRDGDVIRRGSIQYEDFWKFYDKIKRIQENKGKNASASTNKDSKKEFQVCNKTLRVPTAYAKIHTVPFQLKHTDVEDYITKLYPGKRIVVMLV